MEDPAVAEFEEMAGRELGSGDVVGPYHVNPFCLDGAGNDDSWGLAADGRELGKSRARAQQDHRVTSERQ
jgi:hypothetical protein